MPGSLAAEYGNKIDGYSQKIKRYDEEKAEIMKKAQDLEATRDGTQKYSGAFGTVRCSFRSRSCFRPELPR